MKKRVFSVIFFILFLSVFYNKEKNKRLNFKIIKAEKTVYTKIVTNANNLFFLDLGADCIIIFPDTVAEIKEKSIELISGSYLVTKKTFYSKIRKKIENYFYNFKEERIFPERVEQGGLAIHYIKLPSFLSKIKSIELISNVILKLNNNEAIKTENLIPVKKKLGEYYFIIPINVYLEILAYTFEIEINNNTLFFKYKKNYEVIQRKKDFQKIKFNLYKATEILSYDKIKYKSEKQEREVIYKNFNEKLFAIDFIFPVSNSKITSNFGTNRVWYYGNKVILKDIHDGIDFDLKIDDPIFATANGFVRYAKEVELLGRVIVIDHGNSIFSEYYHLNKILVKEGEFVQKGQIIATAGMTGAATDVHLHWGIRIYGIPVNPILFMEFHKEKILNYKSNE